MTMKNTVGQTIKNALRNRGKTQSWLAEQVNVSDTAVSKWIATGQISPANISAVSKLLGITPADLLPETGSRFPMAEPSATYNTEAVTSKTAFVPLISWVQAGDWTEIVDNFQPGAAEEWLPCPVPHSPSTFVLRVRGESMYNPHVRPHFFDGDLIFVDPDEPYKNGSLVVIRSDGNMEATFKKLIIEGDRKYLKAINPAWPEPVQELSDDAHICGVVIFKGERI